LVGWLGVVSVFLRLRSVWCVLLGCLVFIGTLLMSLNWVRLLVCLRV